MQHALLYHPHVTHTHSGLPKALPPTRTYAPRTYTSTDTPHTSLYYPPAGRRRQCGASSSAQAVQAPPAKASALPTPRLLIHLSLACLLCCMQAADDSAVPAAVRRQSKRREQKPLRSQLILDSLRDGITPLQQASRKPKAAGRPLPNSKPAAAGAAAAVVPAAAAQPKKRQRRQQQGKSLGCWLASEDSGHSTASDDAHTLDVVLGFGPERFSAFGAPT